MNLSRYFKLFIGLMIITFFFISIHTRVYSITLSSHTWNLDVKDSLSNDRGAQTEEDVPNFTVKTGYSSGQQDLPFVFSLSKNIISFGNLNPGEPIIRTLSLIISNNPASSYQVLASENHPLQTFSTDATIPDTTCDQGTCQEQAAAWNQPLTYGFGYRCDDIQGNSCSDEFSKNSFYKQFAHEGADKLDKTIISGISYNKENKVEISYKVNVSNTQPKGSYQNVIKYIAIPSF